MYCCRRSSNEWSQSDHTDIPQLHPGVDFSRELGPRYSRNTWPRDGAQALSKSGSISTGPHSSTMSVPLGASFFSTQHVSSARVQATNASELESSDEDTASDERGLEARMGSLHLSPVHARYRGKSSGVKLIRSVFALRNEQPGARPINDALLRTVEAVQTRRPEYWQVYAVRICSLPARRSH
jgi:hypothetical protein